MVLWGPAPDDKLIASDEQKTQLDSQQQDAVCIVVALEKRKEETKKPNRHGRVSGGRARLSCRVPQMLAPVALGPLQAPTHRPLRVEGRYSRAWWRLIHRGEVEVFSAGSCGSQVM